MTTKDKTVKIHLEEGQANELSRKAKQIGFSRSSYILSLIRGKERLARPNLSPASIF